MPRKLTAMTCAVVLLLILPTACNPLDRLFQKQDTDPESCDVTWLLRNASGRELWFEFADFGLHSLQAGQSAEIMRTTVRGSDIQTSFYEVFDYRPQSHPLSIYTDGGSVPARIWTLEETNRGSNSTTGGHGHSTAPMKRGPNGRLPSPQTTSNNTHLFCKGRQPSGVARCGRAETDVIPSGRHPVPASLPICR